MAEPEANNFPSTPPSPSTTSHPPHLKEGNSEITRWDEYNQRLLSQLEQRLNQLAAVKNYPAVKRERDEAFGMLSDAGELVSIQDSKIKTLSENNRRLKDQVRALLLGGGVQNNNSHSQEQEQWRHDANLGRLIRTAMNDPATPARDIPFELAIPLLNLL